MLLNTLLGKSQGLCKKIYPLKLGQISGTQKFRIDKHDQFEANVVDHQFKLSVTEFGVDNKHVAQNFAREITRFM